MTTYLNENRLRAAIKRLTSIKVNNKNDSAWYTRSLVWDGYDRAQEGWFKLQGCRFSEIRIAEALELVNAGFEVEAAGNAVWVRKADPAAKN